MSATTGDSAAPRSGNPDTTRRAERAPSLKLRRKPTDRTPLVRLTWPGQPVLGSLDFDDTEGA